MGNYYCFEVKLDGGRIGTVSRYIIAKDFNEAMEKVDKIICNGTPWKPEELTGVKKNRLCLQIGG